MPVRNRIVFLDWLRGLAAIVMLQGHTFDSFLRPELREQQGIRIKSADLRQSWLERLFLPRIDGVISITNEQSQLYARQFPSLACIYLPLGAEINADESSIDIEKRRAHRQLVYVGRLTQSKGLQSLLRSTSLLAAANIRLAFWAVT